MELYHPSAGCRTHVRMLTLYNHNSVEFCVYSLVELRLVLVRADEDKLDVVAARPLLEFLVRLHQARSESSAGGAPANTPEAPTRTIKQKSS